MKINWKEDWPVVSFGLSLLVMCSLFLIALVGNLVIWFMELTA